jgi:hypothetical protein
MRVNLTDVEVKDFEAIPAGKYVLKVEGHDMRETKGGEGAKTPAGTDMINWEFLVVRHENGDETYANRHLWMNTVIWPTTLFQLKALLLACGWKEDALQGELDVDPEALYGNEFVAQVTRREYPANSGNWTNDVKNPKPLSSLATAGAGGSASLLP